MAGLVTSELERVFTGTAWGEGPVWLPEQHSLRWSDLLNNRIMQHDSRTGLTAVYSDDAEYANGRTLDLAGNVVQCSHGRRRVERDVDGRVHCIADRWAGGRFHSPNDVVVAGDGAIWFTDPPYGITAPGVGHPGEPDYDGCFVFRYDERTNTADPMITDMVHPNGLAFSPDETVLYVSDTSFGHAANGHHHIRAYDVADGACRNGRVLAIVEPGAPDGFRVDAEGRIWTSSASGVQILDEAGRLVQAIPVPEKVSNVCFGGIDDSTLFITAATSLYRIETSTRPAARRRDG